MKNHVMAILLMALVLMLGCADSGSSGGSGSSPPPPPDAPAMPGDPDVTIVNCLYWPASHAYADVRVRMNWSDQADNEDYYEVNATGMVYNPLPIILPADSYKTHVDINVGDSGEAWSDFYVRACNAGGCSDWLDCGRVLWLWDAFDYCTNNPP